MSEAPALERYQLKVVLRGISPLIWRRVVVSSDTTLAELHDVVQVAMGWEDEHLHRFRVHGQDHGLAKIGTPGFGNPRSVRLVDMRLHIRERFLYEYNFQAPWEHDLRLEAKLLAKPRRPWPVCTGGQRACPPEHRYGPEEYRCWLEDRYSFDARWALEEAAELILAAYERRLAGERLSEDERDELQEAAWLMQDYASFNPERFDRKAVNAVLRERWHSRCSSDCS